MLKLTRYAVAGDTTFIYAECSGDTACRKHVFAKDAKGWHEQVRDRLLKKNIWNKVEANIVLENLEQMLEQAEAGYLEKKV